MATEYPGTAVPFPQMALPDLRDPVLSGPGHRALEDAVGSYHQFARSLSDAGGAVGALLTASRVAHEGEAAEVSQQALRTLSEPGRTGAEQSQVAARALEDQGSYVARVRADMQAADPGPTLSGRDAVAAAAAIPTVAPGVAAVAVVGYVERQAAREQAAEAANRYQDNTNWNLGAGFQAFPAPGGPNPDASPGAAGTPGGAPAFQIGPAALGTAGGAGTGVGSGAAAGSLPGGGAGGPAAGPVPTFPGMAGAGPGADGPGSGAGGAGVGRGQAGGAAIGGLPTSAGRGPGVATNGAGTGGAAGSGTGSPARTPGIPAGPGPVGSGVALSPQSYRPGTRGGDPGSGILAGLPPLPGNGVISPGDPATGDRRAPAWGSAVPDGPVDRATLDRQAPQPGGPAGRAAGTGQAGMPFMGGVGAGQGSDREHPRPPWLVQDDPEAFWFAGLPAHSDPVITPDADG